jgi:putative Holliday junction resolvase
MGDLAFIEVECYFSRDELLRVMGLDMGSKTIGVALSDELGLIAQAKETIHRRNIEEDLEAIADLVRTCDVERIVVGLPINMTGTLGGEAQKVLHFVEDMRRVLSVPIIPWDERLSTVQARRVLLEAGLSRKKRKKIIDKTAATVILQTYLDAQGTRTS